MTLFTATDAARRRRAGFTLIEMLVVIGIIIVLVSILLPALNHTYKKAQKARMALDIQAIVTGLEAYKADMRGYPQIDYNDTKCLMTAQCPGAITLCTALLGPGDYSIDGSGGAASSGINTLGFTLRPNGQLYGPYVEPGRFKLSHDPNANALYTTTAPADTIYKIGPPGTSPTANTAGNFESGMVLADRNGHPILYYRANLNATIIKPSSSSSSGTYAMGGGFVGAWTPPAATATGAQATQPYYNFYDNYPAAGISATLALPPFVWTGETTPANAFTRFATMLGDSNADGWISPGEQATTLAPYLLWSPGPDEEYGPDLTFGAGTNLQTASGAAAAGLAAGRAPSCDDATNFTQ